jgi:hypothetical protein
MDVKRHVRWRILAIIATTFIKKSTLIYDASDLFLNKGGKNNLGIHRFLQRIFEYINQLLEYLKITFLSSTHNLLSQIIT